MQLLLDRGEVKAVLRIPPDFTRRVLRREGAQVQMLIDGTDPNPAQAALANSAVIAGAFEQRFNPQKVSVQRLDFRPRLWYNPDLRSSWFMVPGLLGLILMMLIPGMTANAIVREKERGNLEQLLVTPVKPYEFILGKILPYVAIGMMARDIGTVPSCTACRSDAPKYVPSHISMSRPAFADGAVECVAPQSDMTKPSKPYSFFSNVVSSAGCLSMGILLSTLAQNQNQANQMIMFVAIPSILLSGFIFPREGMPAPARLIGTVIPMTYFLKILRGVLLKGAGWRELWPQIWPLGLFGAAMVSLSIRKFRKNLG